MRFGVCTSPDNAAMIAAAGFDYIELTVAWHLKPFAPEAVVLREIEAMLDHTGIRPETFNGLLPNDMKIVGPEVDLSQVAYYLDDSFLPRLSPRRPAGCLREW